MLETECGCKFAIDAGASPTSQCNEKFSIGCLYSNLIRTMKIVRRSLCIEYFELMGYLFVPYNDVNECSIENDCIYIVCVEK